MINNQKIINMPQDNNKLTKIILNILQNFFSASKKINSILSQHF